jgi:CBS domain-containing protein
MDGGRVLRAALAIRRPYDRATQTAATIGQGMAVLFGLFGLFFNPFLVFIALFVWIGAAQEANTAKFSAALDGIPVQQAMISDFKTLHPDDSLDRAVALTLSGSQKDFPIINNGSLAGILTQTDLLKALSERDTHQTVGSAAQKEFVTVSALEMLETAFSKLRACACHTLPVVHAGRLVGLVTMENLGEFMRIQAAMNP